VSSQCFNEKSATASLSEFGGKHLRRISAHSLMRSTDTPLVTVADVNASRSPVITLLFICEKTMFDEALRSRFSAKGVTGNRPFTPRSQ